MDSLLPASASARQQRKADHLEAALDQYETLVSDSCGVLDNLAIRLLDLCKLTTQIQAKSSSISQASLNVSAAKADTQQLLECLDVSKKLHDRIQQGPGKDLDGYLEALRGLEKATNYLQAHSSLSCAKQALADTRMVSMRGMHACHMEFTNVLHDSSRTFTAAELQQAATKDAAQFPTLELELLDKGCYQRLQKLAKTMLRAQFRDCVVSYVQIRESAVNKIMASLGLEAVPLATLQALPFTQLEARINSWVLQLRAFTVVALKERALADSIMAAPASSQVFTEIIGRSFSILMQVGKDITETRRVPDKVFPLLDMYHHISEVMPVLEDKLAAHPEARDMLNDLGALAGALSRMARLIFAEFEDSVARDATPWDVPDGTVHPLCAQVLSFMKRLFKYRNASEVLFRDVAQAEPDTAAAQKHAMSVAIMRILMVLLENLQVKAGAYKNKALQNIFLMNNVHYMVWTVEQSLALELLGQDWVERHKDFVEAYGSAYHDLTWTPLVRLLHVDDGGGSPTKGMLSSVKDRCKQFNAGWEAAHTAQSAWSIPDVQLKAAVKHFIHQDVLPAYQKFVARYRTLLEANTSNRGRYLRYTEDDLRRIIDSDLFESKEPSQRHGRH